MSKVATLFKCDFKIHVFMKLNIYVKKLNNLRFTEKCFGFI